MCLEIRAPRADWQGEILFSFLPLFYILYCLKFIVNKLNLLTVTLTMCIYIHKYERPVYICTRMFMKEWYEVSLGFLKTNCDSYVMFHVGLDQ